MTSYDQAAWRESMKILHAPPRQIIPAAIRGRTAATTALVSRKASELPGADGVKETVEAVFHGTLNVTFLPALQSASATRTVAKYAKRHPEVRSLEDVQGLPLRTRDQMVPAKAGYTLASAGQGGATAIAVTGAEVATTVSGGVAGGVVIAAVAADAVSSLAMMGRTVGVIASRYGYDPRIPEEELFAMGVLSVGLAGTVGAKTQALASLSRLSQRMMRRATWKELQSHVLVKVTDKVYRQLGLRLTHRKLAQTIPVVGVAINASLSAQITEATFRRAQAVYRLRALSETYGIDPVEWMNAPAPDGAAAPAGDANAVDVLEVLEAELVEENETDHRGV